MSGFVDAHHHVWSLARGDYGWLRPELVPIHRDFSLADFAPLCGNAGVTATVLVQAAPTAAETEYLLAVARRSEGLVQGVVGWADLSARDVIPTLHRLARDPLLKAIRPMLQDLPDPAWILQPCVGRALSALPQLGLRFDALVKPAQLPSLLLLLEHHPDLAVVIDHAAKPDIAGQAWEPWAKAMRAAAAYPHVHCKLSGLATEAGAQWTIGCLAPWVDHLFECFGAGRLMWGSDWPVVNLAGSHARWFAATVELLSRRTPEERAWVLGKTARRFYGL
jgi:L-fuconolactonase